jgi:hypothetical protein
MGVGTVMPLHHSSLYPAEIAAKYRNGKTTQLLDKSRKVIET